MPVFISGAYAQQVLKVAVLGPLEVTRDGQHMAVPAGKTSELVVRLALEAGELVRADRLVEDLWAADGVSARRKAATYPKAGFRTMNLLY